MVLLFFCGEIFDKIIFQTRFQFQNYVYLCSVKYGVILRILMKYTDMYSLKYNYNSLIL